jgi:hypothetical protein
MHLLAHFVQLSLNEHAFFSQPLLCLYFPEPDVCNFFKIFIQNLIESKWYHHMIQIYENVISATVYKEAEIKEEKNCVIYVR